VIRLVALALLCALVVGCGGGSTKPYVLAQTRQCLQKNKEVKIGGRLDFVASTATGGALHLRLKHNAVTLVFGETIEDADNINDAYHRFRAKNVGIEDIIRQQRNAVMLFRQHPTDADVATVEGCLSSP
jgi:hypothetical protein